jgi:hypothetical protein
MYDIGKAVKAFFKAAEAFRRVARRFTMNFWSLITAVGAFEAKKLKIEEIWKTVGAFCKRQRFLRSIFLPIVATFFKFSTHNNKPKMFSHRYLHTSSGRK